MKNTIRTLALVLAALAVMVCTLAGCGSNLENGVIMEGVSVAGVDIGGMTKEDAVNAVRLATENTYTKTPMVISILDETITLIPELTGISLDAEAAVDAAYELGRTGSKADRQAQQQQAMTTGLQADISHCLTLDKGTLHEILSKMCETFTSTQLTQSTCQITGNEPDLSAEEAPAETQTLVITLGKPQFQLDIDELTNQVMDTYQKNEFQMEYLCEMTQPDPIDLDAIYEKSFVAPVDAVMNQETFEVSNHTYGYGFDLEQAKELIAQASYGETVEVPFTVTAPTHTKEALESLLFRDVLATHTAYQWSSYSRATNLRLACESLDGVVLNPGEVFDYNQCLGERTAANGYLPAASYVGGETVDSYGGGICQPSSVLYYCALLSDLEIVTRVCHQFISSYMDPGMDATVSWGGPDFRFRNNTPYPIRIEAKADGGSVTISLIGTDVKDYYIEMEYEILSYRGWDDEVVEVHEDNNPKGYKDGEVISTPYTGYTVVTYKCRYNKADDTLIERVKEADSRYDSRNRKTVKIIKNEPEETEPEETKPYEPPVTEPPVTEPPVTEPPVTEPPVTEPPVTEPPVTEPPAGTPEDPSGSTDSGEEGNPGQGVGEA